MVGRYGKTEEKAQLFIDRLSVNPRIREIRHKGLMLGVELESPETVRTLIPLMAENGLITDSFLFRPGAFRIAPPLIITSDQIIHSCNLINKCLNMS